MLHYISGCVGEYFNDSGSSSDDDKESDKKLLGYKCVLTSKATEEAMVFNNNIIAKFLQVICKYALSDIGIVY